jgi:hypothetical protein
MPPSIPTHRPLMTATRSALLIAIAAVVCSVFLVVDNAYSRIVTEALAPGDGWDCAERAVQSNAAGLVGRADDDPLPLR